ncbi:AAA family ATPase, partial [Butyrivibrio sp.]|uniref:ParA family protein n=1 Tax=Butyrivibrio sp. TaxID=28121 RepID=UPI0025BDD041
MNGVISRETILRQYVNMMRERCDCMPSLGILTINALACADSVLIPVSAGYLP